MPLDSKVVTLNNTTPTLIVDADNMIQDVHLHNMTKSSNQFVHLGGPDMTLANSIHIDPGESLSIRLNPKDRLFGMSDPDGIKVGVMTVRKND